MNPACQHARLSSGERGYAYLLVMFLLALLIVGTMAAVPNVLIEGRREKEEEMIWRGNQYVRGIRLYVSHRTNASHRLPTSLEDLTKGKLGVHFLRQAYKDPINTKDGSWRLIYVGPSGQLIGSTRPQLHTLTIPGLGPTPAAALASSQNQSGGSPNGPLSMSGPAGNATGQPGNPSQQGTNTSPSANSQETAPGSADSNSTSNAPPEVPPDGASLIGGNIIGIGSKISKKSIIWYDKARNYRDFEFIWDPSKDAAAAAQQGTAVAPAQNGQTNPNPSPSPNP